MSSLIRINKLLSQAGIASRRKADDLVRKGAVTLNGAVLDKPGALIDTARDKVAVNGKELRMGEERDLSYFLLNKPKGYICTCIDTHGRKTVLELLPRIRGLFTIGRLDKETTGIILITNDGELAHRLMHPSYEVEKIYDVSVRGGMSDKDIKALGEGVDIKDKRPSVCEVLTVKRSKGKTRLLLRLHEGRKRQIRRTFETLGYSVTSLKRISYGGIRVDIKEGEHRELKDEEVMRLKKQAELI